ncbi:hypothetical protein N7470_008654 [Penicillium chermesinum]|nr:hypothetical protein N7470_008654 [Penicillium chermesinum]
MPVPELMDVATALRAKHKSISVVGLVVDHLPPMHTRGSSICVTFTIKDSHWDTPSWADGLKIKYFHDDERVAYNRNTVPWAIFRSDPNPSAPSGFISGPIPINPTYAEKRAASLILTNAEAYLHQSGGASASYAALPSQTPRSQVVQASVGPRKSHLPFTLVKDAIIGTFGQFIGQVIKDNDFDSERVTLWMTDYTSHESLTDYTKEEIGGQEGDPHGYLTPKYAKKWPGPWGKMTVPVTLWEPHASWARQNVKPGNIILLTYVRPKDNGYGGMEFAVSTDKKFPDKIHVQLTSPDYDERARELIQRRKEYWKVHGIPKDEDKEAGNLTKKKKTAGKKKNEKIEEGQPRLPTTSSKMKLNPNVRYPNNGIPVRSLESILSADTHINTPPGGITYKLPFQNVSYLTQARVVDYFPPKLEDFAVKVPNKSMFSSDHMDIDGSHTSWEWRFCLLLEGTDPILNKKQHRPQMKVFLREKLFILWGDLEECKLAAASSRNLPAAHKKPSSTPFICCVKEYGIPCTHLRNSNAMVLDEGICGQGDCLGWERRFAISGTSIKS